MFCIIHLKLSSKVSHSCIIEHNGYIVDSILEMSKRLLQSEATKYTLKNKIFKLFVIK